MIYAYTLKHWELVVYLLIYAYTLQQWELVLYFLIYAYTLQQWELACSNEWIPSMIASIQMAGLFLVHFISGHLADRFGRKVPLMLSLILMLIFNIAAFFAQSWIVLAVARAIVGKCIMRDNRRALEDQIYCNSE